MTDVTELGIDDFEDEKDWEQIRPLDLIISTNPDEDGVYDVFYKSGEDDGILCSEVKEDDMDEGEIQDIAYIMFPIFHNIKHKREVVQVEANFLIGYVGENGKTERDDITIFEFPLFWNGTINVGDRDINELFGRRVQNQPDLIDLKNDIAIDITRPIGKYIMEVDSGGEKWDIDDYELEERQSIINHSAAFDDYKIEFNKGTDVFRIIDKVFLKPQEKINKEGVVTILTEEGKRSLEKQRKKFNKTFEEIKTELNRLKNLSVIKTSDLKKIKDKIPELTYDRIDDDTNEFSSRDNLIREGVRQLFNVVLATQRKQKEAINAPPVEVPRPATLPPVPITKLEELTIRFNEIKKLLGDAMALYNQGQKTIQVTRDINKYKLEAVEVAKLIKEEKEGTGIIDNPELYEKAKQIADEKYKKHSAYKSGFIIKKYKELGGTYSGDKPNKTGIARWFKEEWKDIGNAEYPVYRPTKRVTIETPLTPDEIKPSNLKKQIALKQEIKGKENLPPFVKKGGKVVALGVQAEKIPKADDIWKWSNPVKVAEMAKKYLGDMAVVFRSTKPKKKYMIFDPINNKWVFFGEMGYEDFTKHQDPKRRENYLTRTASMKGNWKNNRYSANNLSRNILW